MGFWNFITVEPKQKPLNFHRKKIKNARLRSVIYDKALKGTKTPAITISEEF